MKGLLSAGLRWLVCTGGFAALCLTAYAQPYHERISASRKAKLVRFVQDPNAPLKEADMSSVHYFEPDSTFRVLASVALLHNERPFRMPTSDGTSKEYVRFAEATFVIREQTATVVLYRSKDLFANPVYRDHLFLPFTDPTNGSDTYGGGRYLDLSAADIQDGRMAIDFNDAYNPYCAYSGGYRCPIPPAENDLPIAIRAGEKRYTGLLKQRPVSNARAHPLTQAERALVFSGDTTTLLRVIQDSIPDELRKLKAVSTDVDPADSGVRLLARRMYLAVTDSSHAGVGIAAPQVGVNRNLIWVQRFDKADEPLEAFLNPRITWRSALLRRGVEGCLSIADKMDTVLRNYTIRIAYQDLSGQHIEELVEGFTAVIFQHEIDHLYGILFTDRLVEQATESYRRINEETDLYINQRQRRQ